MHVGGVVNMAPPLHGDAEGFGHIQSIRGHMWNEEENEA